MAAFYRNIDTGELFGSCPAFGAMSHLELVEIDPAEIVMLGGLPYLPDAKRVEAKIAVVELPPAEGPVDEVVVEADEVESAPSAKKRKPK